MPSPDPKRVAKEYLARQHSKTAGEVIFKKDRSGDVDSWAYTDVAPSQRDIPRDFNYAPRHQKPLAQVLRSTLAALGYTLMAYNRFAKLKSSRLSPDGNLGGRGYIQKIQDMRKQYMNSVEALSALSDTLHDEINAPHWALISRQEGDQEKAEVSQIIEEAQTIREDPEEWAEKETAEELEDPEGDEESKEEPETGSEDFEFGEALAGADERTKKNEADPDAWMDPPAAMGRRAARRVAVRWISAKDLIPGGLADKKSPFDFDPKQLSRGTRVEMEHTNSRTLAREIAMDHLSEDPKYYDKLKTIEGEH